MQEKNLIFLICGIIFVLSFIATYFFLFNTDFNFYKSEIRIEGDIISETLYFKPNKDYHTLFRTFKSPLFFDKEGTGEYVQVLEVNCGEGIAYARKWDGCKFYQSDNKKCLPYTEPNEYGCSFGDELGFKKGKQYQIKATYKISSPYLFNIDNKNYIKFIAYSKNQHKTLVNKKNLLILGDSKHKNLYYPKESVIIFIPYEGKTEGKQVLNLNNFEYGNSNSLLVLVLISILPALIVYTIWFFLGKEKSGMDLPESMSYPPQDRKAWEIAAFFSPPFNVVDNNFFSAVLLDLYNRKVIDIKMKKKIFGEDSYIKINDEKLNELDNIEREFIDIFCFIRDNAKEKHKDGDYVDFANAAKTFSLKREIILRFRVFDKKIKEEGKKYVSTTGNSLISTIFAVILFITVYFITDAFDGIASFTLFFGLVLTTIISTAIISTAMRKGYNADNPFFSADEPGATARSRVPTLSSALQKVGTDGCAFFRAAGDGFSVADGDGLQQLLWAAP